MAAMDAVRLGRSVRALRIRRGWRQVDLAAVARLSPSIVSRLERGVGKGLTNRSLERIAAALGARLVVRLDWQGEALDRLLDAGHAALVEQVVVLLRAAGWEVVPEATFAIRGERGSIDVLAWHAESRSLLVIEVKSVVPDVQAMLGAVDRKTRLAPAIAAERGWRPERIAVLLVIGESRTSRRRVARHATTFATRFPDRIAAIRRFIASPGASPVVRGLWFLPFRTGAPVRHRASRQSASRRA
jgi:transcriptional regulator with XRE-family HTH domain